MQLNLHLFSDLSLESMSLSKHLLTKKEDGGKIVFSGSLDLREAVKAIKLKINEEDAKSMDLVFSEKLGLLKSIKSDTVSPSMFMLWESQTFRMGKLTAFYKRQKKNHCVTASPQPQSISGC